MVTGGAGVPRGSDADAANRVKSRQYPSGCVYLRVNLFGPGEIPRTGRDTLAFVEPTIDAGTLRQVKKTYPKIGSAGDAVDPG